MVYSAAQQCLSVLCHHYWLYPQAGRNMDAAVLKILKRQSNLPFKALLLILSVLVYISTLLTMYNRIHSPHAMIKKGIKTRNLVSSCMVLNTFSSSHNRPLLSSGSQLNMGLPSKIMSNIVSVFHRIISKVFTLVT